VVLERGPLSLVNTTEELLGWKSSSYGLEILEYSLGIHRAVYETPLYPQKFALTTPTCAGRSVGIVRSRTNGHGVCFWLFIKPVTGHLQMLPDDLHKAKTELN
jgi:hypothetical protein